MNRKLDGKRIQLGDPLPAGNLLLNRTHIVRMAGAAGDFHPQHHDDLYAQKIGRPSVIAMGLLPGGLLSKYISDWAGDGVIMRYKITFKNLVWPDERLYFSGLVTGIDDSGGRRRVSCRAEARDAAGELKVTVEADIDAGVPV